LAVGLFLGDAEARRAEADSVSPRKTPDLLHPVALVENPISEGGNRVHGETIGVDWADCPDDAGLRLWNRIAQGEGGRFDRAARERLGTRTAAQARAFTSRKPPAETMITGLHL